MVWGERKAWDACDSLAELVGNDVSTAEGACRLPAWHSDENYRLAILCAPNYSGMGGEHGLFDHVIFYWGFGGCGPFQTFTLKFWIGGVAKKSQRCCFGSLRKGLAWNSYSYFLDLDIWVLVEDHFRPHPLNHSLQNIKIKGVRCKLDFFYRYID